MFNVTQVVLVLKAKRGHGEHLRLGTLKGQRKPLVKMQPHLQLMAQDWRSHAKELRLRTMKRAYGRLLVKPSYNGRQQCIRDASTMRWPPRTAAAVGYRQLEPRRQAVCYKGQGWRSDPVGSQTLDSWSLSFAFNCDCALIFFPLEGRKYFSGPHS